MIREIIVILFIALIIFTISGCGPKSEGGERENPLVVATTTIIADVAREIAGERAEIYCIMPIGGDPHIYQPVPGDARKIAQSDLVFYNGLELEGWLIELARNAGGSRAMIAVTNGIAPLRDEQRRGEPDPHAWFDVRNMRIYVDNIVSGLTTIDPEGKEYYLTRANVYKEKLGEVDMWVRQEIQKLPQERRILITSHDAFRYFGAAYDVKVIGLQGISTEARPQTRDVVRVIETIKAHNVPAVFIETSVNPKMLEQIAIETGARIGGELFSDSIGNPDHEGGSYIGMVQYNVRTFVEAMKKEAIVTKQ